MQFLQLEDILFRTFRYTLKTEHCSLFIAIIIQLTEPALWSSFRLISISQLHALLHFHKLEVAFLGNKLLVRGLDVVLIHYRILHGGADLRMTEDFLHLLNGHSLVDGAGSHGAAEFMRVDLVQIQLPAQLPDRKSTRLNSSHNVASRMPSSA